MATMAPPIPIATTEGRAEAVSIPAPPSGPIPELDGLRGIAILLVFLTHFIALYLRGGKGVDALIYGAARFGWTGVDLFFVLSGFLITGVLLRAKGAPHYWRNYAARRCLRILPLYFGALAIAFLVLPAFHWDEPQYATLRSHQFWYWTYLVNLLQVLQGPGATPLNTSHLWSLCVEEQFYLVWPFVVLAATPRGLVRIALWTVAAGMLFRVAMLLGPGAEAAYVLTPGRLDGLMMGAVLAVAAQAPGGLVLWRRTATHAGVVGGLGMLALGLWRGMEYGDPVIALAGYPLLALTFGGVLVLAQTTTGWWPRLLRSAFLRQWGKYSYGLYLIHFPLLWVLDDRLGALFTSPGLVFAGSRLPGVLLRCLVGVPLAYGIAWASYELYERRFLALKRCFA